MDFRAPDINSYQDLKVYQSAVRLQQAVFRLSRSWPKAETYSLIDQIRRSSRSIGANVAEAWAKRRYPAHFLSKLTDADAELQETKHWIFTAAQCGYLQSADEAELARECRETGGMLGAIITKHQKFCIRPAAPDVLDPSA
jgi:four helix bundle protein